jgi:hypothetical protein
VKATKLLNHCTLETSVGLQTAVNMYTIILILGWCILLRLYFNEEIQPPLFATTTYRVFIVHELHYMFRPYICYLQVYHIYKMIKIITITLTDPLILYKRTLIFCYCCLLIVFHFI